MYRTTNHNNKVTTTDEKKGILLMFDLQLYQVSRELYLLDFCMIDSDSRWSVKNKEGKIDGEVISLFPFFEACALFMAELSVGSAGTGGGSGVSVGGNVN